MLNRNRPPTPQSGYRYEWRDGCDCKSCPAKGQCRGESGGLAAHWVEVKENDKRN